MTEADDRAELLRIVKDLYASVSAPAGVTPPVENDATHLHPEVRQCRTVRDSEGRPVYQIMDREAFEASARTLVTDVGFFEVETAHEAFVYQNIAHVISHYDAFADEEQTQLLKRGVNSIQFLRVDGEWKVFSMIWDDEVNRMVYGA